jgi:hypothetical protein
MNKQNTNEFKEELQLLTPQLQPEELFILGFLKGFTRSDLKCMIQDQFPQTNLVVE